MPNPVTKFTPVGVQVINLYPWNGTTGPYDATTVESLEGLQTLGFQANITTVEGRGGESVDAIFGTEVARDREVKIAAFRTTYRMLQLIMGGTLTVDLDNPAGAGNEVQLWTNNHNDRAPYFRLVGQSNINGGLVQIVCPKCKITGSFAYNFEKESIVIPDFSAKVFYDSTYTRLDGQAGGASVELFYGAAGTYATHS